MTYPEALKNPIFKIIADVAEATQVECYVIGGFVRDFLLKRENGSKDIDVVAVGSGIDLALAVSERLPHKPKVQVFKNYGTAMLRFEDTDIEFVGARKESYHFESRKPAISAGIYSVHPTGKRLFKNQLCFLIDVQPHGRRFRSLRGINTFCCNYPDANEFHYRCRIG